MEERIHQRQERQDIAGDIPFAVPAHDASVSMLSSGDESADDVDSEFEFPFVSRCSPALADELFADGRIRPLVYPVFGRRGAGETGTEVDTVQAPAAAAQPAAAGRKRGQLGRLFLEETRERNSSSGSTASSSSAATDDGDGHGHSLEGAPPESYCVWAPGSSASPRPPRKSGSTGSMARWRRISDLVVGRSHSDGKEKFLFLPTTTATPPPPNRREGQKPKPKPKPSPASGGKKPLGTEINTVAAAQRIAYGTKAGGATPRRTFLPYREELVGFFANVHGISRSHPHPY